MEASKRHEMMEKIMAEKFGIPPELSAVLKTHKYKGTTFNGMSPPQILDAIPDFETREEDVFITSYPKSGTHWLWEVVLLIWANGDKEKIDRTSMLSTPFETVALPDMKRPTYELVAQAKSPRSIITHLPWQFLPKQLTEQKKGKIIYIIRNPKDTLSSVCRFFLGGQDREEHIWPSLLQNFLEGEIPSGGWYEHVSEYLKYKDNENVLIISYEEMKLNFAQVAKSIAKFLGKDLDEEALKKVAESATVKGMKKSYDDMEKNIPGGEFVAKAMGNKPFIHKGVIGSWKNSFTVSENEMFDKIYGEKVASLGLDFIYEA